MSDEQGKTQGQMIDELIAGLGSSEETDIKSPETETKPDETVDGAEPVSEEIEAGEEFEEEEEIEERVVAEAEPEPEGEVETEEEVVEEEVEVDELAELREQNRLLQERVETLSSFSIGTQPAPQEPETTPTSAPAFTGFLAEGESVDDILDDPKKFNEFAMRIYSRAKEDARTEVLRSIPNVVIHQVQQQRVLNDAIEEFYKENEDLKPVRRTVGVVTNEVVSEHPDWALDKVLDEVAKKTRQVLGMKQRVESRIKKRVRKPALVKKKTTSSAKPASPNISELERDILDTIL